jgi:hypothetical protein
VAKRARAKTALPGFVLAPVEGRRNEENTGEHTALVIDVDALAGEGPEALQTLLARCERYTCTVYETPSSTDEAPRVRVIAALGERIQPGAVPAARRAFAEALGLDPERCGTAGALPASQVMFAGRVRGTRERGLWTFEGELWCPPVAAAAPPRRERTRVAPTPRAPRASAPGAFPFDAPPDLSAIAKHVPPPGVDGDRHLLVRGLGGWLGRRGYAPEAIAEAVRLQIPSNDPGERAAQARDAADRVRADLEAPGWEALSAWAERYGKGASTLRRLERACRDPREPEGFGGVWSEWWAENWPRIEARFARLRGANDVQPEGSYGEIDATGLHLHPRTGWPWILQKGDFYWIHRVDAQAYRREVRASELDSSVARYLAGMIDEDRRTPKDLRAAWVQPLEHLRTTYMARRHTYDADTNTLTLAALRWTSRTAKRHAHIDRWLRALFGGGYDAAAQWLASLIALDRPAPCLYLPGAPRLGKSLLASGLAALWNRPAPAKMKEAISDFNEASAECPLVFTDEGFPPDLDFNAFRDMVTEHSRRVNAKYRAKADVEGCARFLICANNEDVLRYQKTGTLSRNDLDAITDRLLVIPCHAEAEAEVRKLDTTAAAGGEIAEHVLWLAETVELEPGGERMAARPGGGERILANVVAGRSAEILTRVREAIGTGALGEKSGVHVPKRAPGEVWINVPRLHETLAGRVALPAVKELCESFMLRSGTEQRITSDGHNLRWRVLDRAQLDDAFAKLD